MSRLLLNRSTVLQRAANTVAAAGNATPAPTSSSTTTTLGTQNNHQRRWKSLLQNYTRSAQKQRRFIALSQREAAGAKSGILTSGGSTAAIIDTTKKIENHRGISSTTAVAAAKSGSSNMSGSKCLQVDNINPNFIAMEYAVRGPLVIRAGEIERELQKGAKKPFDQVIRANIGDAHAMGQQPLTFIRQLLACCFDPSLIECGDYPEDVKCRAREILKGCSGGSVGSYTDSAGLEVVRRQVANFIEKRDGLPSEWRNIFLTAGATPGIKSILALMQKHTDGKPPGIMVPIPQYPLYSATIAEYGMAKVDYYLKEEDNWSLDRTELQRALEEGKKCSSPRAIVIINPGNPTGQVLTHANIVDIIKFAYDNKLVILADEVYQDNVYDKNSKFFSFKKVLNELGAPYKDMEIVSFMSTSKGYLGECGIRGGYMEIMNMCPNVQAMLAKSITAALCSTTAGQVAVSALVNPPQPGEPSYEKYIQEKDGVLKSLKERSELIYHTLNSFEGFKVNVVQGAMYVFPQIEIPPKAVEAAKAKNMPADTFYAFELLETTGICIIPGSGFGQKPGTYHFRTTILPQVPQLKIMMNKFKDFHTDFMKKYK